MKAEELMIGDWVDFGSFKRQVIQSDYCQDVNGDCILDGARPIHLTNEIMNAHFPDYEPGYTIGWWPNDDSTFHVEWQQDLEGNEVILMHVMYVHELQHLLRMVRYNKAIEL